MNVTSKLFPINVLRNGIFMFQRRSFLTSSVSYLKEIREKKEGNKLIIEAAIVPSPRQPYLLNVNSENGACAVCSSGLDIKHTDVLILSQFVRNDGCMLPRRITGLCKMQQKRISKMVTMAQKAGLMSNINPANSKQDPRKRRKWKKFNTYFDESTIKV